jgi:enamine deaminase RidA (YjgF/YER057c/UK114 family)
MAKRDVPPVSIEGDWVFVGRTDGAPAHTMRAQVEQALARIAGALAPHGLTLRNVTRARYLVPHGPGADDFAGCRDLIAAALGDRNPQPTFIATGLGLPGARIEIEVHARRG